MANKVTSDAVSRGDDISKVLEEKAKAQSSGNLVRLPSIILLSALTSALDFQTIQRSKPA